MAQHKIPAFLSKKFHSLGKEEKQRLLERYIAWKESDITQLLQQHLADAISSDEETENKATFDNEFKSLQEYAWHRGYRTNARHIIKQLERDE